MIIASYPNMNIADGNTKNITPLQVLERIIKQSIRVTKDVSQESYNTNNQYAAHKDPFTVLFGGYVGTGNKYVKDFKFKAYLVSDLVKNGYLTEKDSGEAAEYEDEKELGYVKGDTYDYDTLFNRERYLKEDGTPDVAAYEAKMAELDTYAVEWDTDEYDKDGDLTTLHASENSGSQLYYGTSARLPYGLYVVVEQIPDELVNKHYEIDEPKEIEVPYAPQIDSDGTVHDDTPSGEYVYWASKTPEELAAKYAIRFNEETNVIQAHNNDGDYEIYKYGLDWDVQPTTYGNETIGERYKWSSTSEDAGTVDNIYYKVDYDNDGNVIDYGVVKNGVATMAGKTRAINGKYSMALVPWSILDPVKGGIIDDEGNWGNRDPQYEADDKNKWNYVSYAMQPWENSYYSSKLRVEKVDAKTGENIIHEGALFKLYLTSRDVTGAGSTSVAGTGNVEYKTEEVTGTRTELEARGDVDNITWDSEAKTYRGTVTSPVYDESEQVFMLDNSGSEVGIFKAFSTEREVVKDDGSISKEKVGYIETYQPLGAGTYVLVEVQAPEGYQKSKPIAFEVYKDKTTYYDSGDSTKSVTALRYQYVTPVKALSKGTKCPICGATGETKGLAYDADRHGYICQTCHKYTTAEYTDVSQIVIKDSPSDLFIHKVEDGDDKIGDVNGLNSDTRVLTNANDKGDLLDFIVDGKGGSIVKQVKTDEDGKTTYEKLPNGTDETFLEYAKKNNLSLSYIISGRKEYLEARGDVENITFNTDTKEWQGTVVKTYDQWSENIVEITEAEALSEQQDGYDTKPLYDIETGGYTGFAIRFGIKVNDAVLTLYNGLQIEKTGEHSYKGIEVSKEAGKTVKVTATPEATGQHLEILKTGTDTTPPYYNIWDTKKVDNENMNLLFVDLETADTETDENGELWILDERGNRVFLADSSTGMAYTYDDYGRMIAYEADENNDRVVTKSIVVMSGKGDGDIYVDTEGNISADQTIDDKANEHIYVNIETADDEVGLPLYYTSGNVTYKDEIWTTNGAENPHEIQRLPFGAYIIEETTVPYSDGYIQAKDMGIVLEETSREQHFFFQNDFTKTNFAKIDITGKDEIKDATMTIYTATRVDDSSEKGYHLVKGDVYTTWISGYEYDDDGNMKYEGGKPIETNKPHWVDHIPTGYYIFEETITPYNQGYVQSEALEIYVAEDGNVQTFKMEDDYTATEIVKLDADTGEVLSSDHSAKLSLYKANVDGNGNPIFEERDTIPGINSQVYDSVYTTWVIKGSQDYLLTKTDRKNIRWNGTTYEGTITIPLNSDKTALSYDPATLLSEDGTPAVHSNKTELIRKTVSMPSYSEDNFLCSWDTSDGLEVALTRHTATNEYGDSYIAYDYDIHYIDNLSVELSSGNTKTNAYYYVTETGATRFHYLPVGYYVVTETYKDAGEVKKGTPEGYATAQPVLIYVDDVGRHEVLDDEALKELSNPYIERRTDANNNTETINVFKMVDTPLKIDLSKVNVTGGNEVDGATLIVWKINDDGSSEKVEEWISGSDGFNEDKTPKAHRITNIPEGSYQLEEKTTPYGFLRSVVVDFTVSDTGVIQYSEMIDEIPDGKLTIIKHDIDNPSLLLPNATFTFTNKDTGELVETLTTKADGKIVATKNVPIGWMDASGKFNAFTYVIEEIDAPEGYMLSGSHEFQFTYIDDATSIIPYQYDAKNKQNQVIISKKILSSGDELPGASLRIDRVEVDERTKKETLTLYTEFISGEQETYITGIPDGKYRLTETRTPEGNWVLADSIDFEIVHNTLETPTVTMYDASSIVEVDKVKGSTTSLVAGAKMQLLNEAKDTVLYEWTSSDTEGYKMYGLDAGIYWIHEVSAPKGYKIGEDVQIEVLDDATTKQVFTFANYARSSGGGGGGGGTTPEPNKSIVIVKENPDSQMVADAVYGIYTEDGTKISEGATDVSGSVRLGYNEAGRYYYKEISAPSGYSLNPDKVYITIDEKGKLTDGSIMAVDDYAKINIIKLDSGDLTKRLKGAEFTLYTLDGAAVSKTTSGEDGVACFSYIHYGEYYIEETKAPTGYKLSEEKKYITVDEHYINEEPMVWTNDKDADIEIPWIPKTGDFALLLPAAGIGLLSAAAILIRKRRRKHFYE